MFYDRFIDLCNKKGVKPTPLVVELGLSSSNASQWKKGSTPRPDILQKIADYFDVTVGYLVGSEEKENPAPEGAERIPNYSKLTDTNRAIVDSMIAQLLAAQLNDQ